MEHTRASLPVLLRSGQRVGSDFPRRFLAVRAEESCLARKAS